MAAPTVLHVLPIDLSRGAQTYARALRDALDGGGARHRTVALFAAREPGALHPDRTLGVPDGPLRRAGLDPRAVRGLRQVLREDGPAVVVAHGGEPLKYAVLAGVAPAQLVYFKIGAANERLTGRRRFVHDRLVSRAAMVVAVSEAAAAEAREHGVPEAKLRVVPNGRDPAPFAEAARAARDGSGPVRLVFVGHLDPPKRPERFVALVRALRDAGADVHGVVAGDGPLRSEVAAGGVEVLGAVDDVPGLLARADVLVLTSRAEGMPGVLIEAGLAGLPAVTTAVPGASDVVADGSTGFVVPVDDFDALVARTRELVDDPALRATFGAAARARCESRFSLAASVQAWRAVLEEVTAGLCTSST